MCKKTALSGWNRLFLPSIPGWKSSYLVILSFSAFFEIKGPGIEYCPGKASGEEMVK